jgi:O-antigen/teichoic acid export membrane protein
MGIWQIAIALTRLSVFIPILWLRPNLNGYYLATIITAGLSLSMNIVSSTWLWRQEGLAVWEWPGAEAWKRYMREWRFLFHGNLLGYVKMLHRSVDMLVVGAFCGDREAGLYKLARVLLDHLLRLFHVMNQVYLPQLLEMLSARAHVAYLRLSARLAAAAGAITAAGLLAEWLVLPALVIRVLGSSFEGLVPPLMWMTASFFFVAGIHLWTYAAIMHGGMMRQLALFSFLAVAVQYFLMLSLFNVWGASATAAATGYFSYYGVRAAASVRLTHRLLETMRTSHS